MNDFEYDDPQYDVQPDVQINPCYQSCTVCTGNHFENIFWRMGAPGFPGQCILDQMTYDQLYAVIQRVPIAREHLERITSDPKILRFARETPTLISEQEDDNRAADMINKGGSTGANTLPFYTSLRGNPFGQCYLGIEDFLDHPFFSRPLLQESVSAGFGTEADDAF